MDYLARETAPFAEDFWGKIDGVVIETASRVLRARRFISLLGPLGIGADHITVDKVDDLAQTSEDGVMVTTGRKYLELPTLYEDFELLGKDIETAKKAGYPLDLGKVAAAAENCAVKEDKLIFFGHKDFQIEGLFTAKGSNKIKRMDWAAGENAFANIAEGITLLAKAGIYGPYALALSQDLYLQLQRLQAGTGLLEIERVEKLLGGHVYPVPALGKEKAVLVAVDARNLDLVIGQDLAAAYLEQVEFNHRFRILETMRLRIKRPQSIVVFE